MAQTTQFGESREQILGKGHIDFSSRISARAVIAGVAIGLSTMTLFMLLAGGFELWKFRMSEIPRLETSFWIWAFASWILSISLGAFVASIASRSITRRDALLQAITTWAVACISGCVILAMGTGQLFDFASDTGTRGMYWFAFFGDFFALTGALFAGNLGYLLEMREVKQKREGLVEKMPRIGRAAG